MMSHRTVSYIIGFISGHVTAALILVLVSDSEYSPLVACAVGTIVYIIGQIVSGCVCRD